MSYSFDESYAVYHETMYRARKAHECDACELPIRPGDEYTRVFILGDGSKQTIKRCLRCQAMHEHLRELAPGERWPAERLDCGQKYEDEWERPPPDWVTELAFWVPGDPLPARRPCTWLVQGGYMHPEPRCCRKGSYYRWSPEQTLDDSKCNQRWWDPGCVFPCNQREGVE